MTTSDRTNESPSRERAMERRSAWRGVAARLGRWAPMAVPVVAVVFAAACNELDNALNVDTPKQIPADGLAVPKNAALLVNGAIGDFECAYGSYVALSALLSHEMVDATQTADRWPYDRRDVRSDDARYGVDDCTALGVYEPISTARWSAENILTYLQGWTDQEVSDRQKLMAQSAAFAAYSYVIMAEGFCQSAVNLSPAMGLEELLDSAVVRFGTALTAAQAAGDQDLVNLAHVGRARAYLDLDQGQQAVADAQVVPAGFEYDMTASGASSRRYNRVFTQSGNPPTGGDALSVGPAYRNVTWMGDPDPRVSVLNAGYTQTEGTPIWFQEKYRSQGAPIPIASYDEAQLIIAEVQGGQTAVDIINAFHQSAGLQPFSSSDPAAIQAHVVQERDRVLWLTGHRFFDIRRLDLTLDPAPGTPYHKGNVYGSTLCLPLPDVERNNNPNIG
jgi:starch-binding outer membrane protein, SusD/RagB family